MANILVVESDIANRALVQLHLETGGHQTTLARDGAEALRRVQAAAPDAIVAALNLPVIDGFGLLRALRSEPAVANLPVIFIRSLNHPSSDDAERQCRLLGASTFLSMPVARQALLDAVLASVAGTPVRTTSELDPSALRRSQQQRTLPGQLENTMRFGIAGAQDPHSGGAQVTAEGSILFIDIRNFTAFAEALSAPEVVELLDAFLREACEPVRHQGGWVVKFLGDGFVAMFEAAPLEAEAADHAERALKAALLIVLAAHRFRSWIAQRFPGRTLPAFATGVGVHCGEVVVWRMGNGEGAETTVIGDTVNVAARLESLTKEFGWSICVSRVSAERAGARFLRGAVIATELKGKARPVEVVEITGLAPRVGATSAEQQAYQSLSEAVSANTESIRSTAVRRAAPPPVA